MMRGLDAEAAEKAVSFIESLRHTKGRWAGVPFALAKWQRKEIIEPLFGTVNEDGTRRYRTAYIEIPRKNGKSELVAAIGLKLLFGDGEEGGEIYLAAADRDQASIVFNIAAEMVRRSKTLSRMAKVIDSTKRIIAPKTGNMLRAIPADAGGAHGFNPSGVIADELHVWPKRDLWDALTTGMSRGGRRQPLVIAITTAGYDRNSICWELHDYARQVIEGTVDDPEFFAVIYSAPDEADWRRERMWRRANPALGEFRDIEDLKMFARRAEATPALQNTFRRLFLNQWTQQHDRWIDLALWDDNAGSVQEDELRGHTCYGGLDLSSVSDLTAWVMVFPSDDDTETVDVVARLWCPEKRLHAGSNRYRDQYIAWHNQGWLTATPGEAIDHNFVKEQILRDAETFHLIDLNLDRLFQAHQIALNLAEEGLTVVGLGQGFSIARNSEALRPVSSMIRRMA